MTYHILHYHNITYHHSCYDVCTLPRVLGVMLWCLMSLFT